MESSIPVGMLASTRVTGTYSLLLELLFSSFKNPPDITLRFAQPVDAL